MVQRKIILEKLLKFLLRPILFVAAVYMGAYISGYCLRFMEYLGYHQPSGFFGFTLEDLLLSWIMGFVFWALVFFGVLGKRIDLIISAALFLFGLMFFWGLDIKVTLSFVAVAATAALIGFFLKLVRLMMWTKN